jgi:hypothetical protein
MKKLIVIFCLPGILFVNCVSSGNAGNNNQGFNSKIHGELFVEKSAGFSMYIPQGWGTIDLNQKYLVVVGPREDNFSPNIVFGDEQYAGSVSEYVDKIIAQISKIYDAEVIENEVFITNTGLQGRYAKWSARMNETHARQIGYFIKNKSGTAIMVIACSVASAGGTKYDELFEECVKTFNWTK